MSSIRLNRPAIAANLLPCCGSPPGLDAIERDTGPLLLTRRQLLKAAGTAAVVATGANALVSLEPLTHASMGVRARGAWLRAGRVHTTLDPLSFAGSPKLTVSAEGAWHATLEGARFPGVAIPAGIDLLVTGSGALARLLITHDLGGFRAEVPLADWLEGKARAIAPVKLACHETRIDANSTLTLSGQALATLSPDWSMRLEGRGIAAVTGFGETLLADAITIGLATAATTSLFTRKIARRSLLTLERGSQEWHVDSLPASPTGSLQWSPNTFDRLTLEAAETTSGRTQHAAVAFGSGDANASWNLAALDARLPLTNLRYARTFGPTPAFQAAASFAEKPVWIPVGDRAFLVGAGDWTEPFELAGEPGKAVAIVSPAVHAISVPMDDAVSEPIRMPAGAKQTIDLGDQKRDKGGVKASAIVIDPGTIVQPPVVLPWAASVSVIRPEDLLSLKFEFFNLSLVGSGATAHLVRSSSSYPCYISVTFPAQHILEQAVRDPQDLPLPSGPFKSYLADETRLAFVVSSTRLTQGITYSLAGLLDWSGFTHSVVPAARLTATSGDLKTQMRQPSPGSSSLADPPQTSMELPWGLYLSPYESEYWKHRSNVFTKGGRTELWYTKLHGRPLVFGAGVQASALQPPSTGGNTGGVTLPPLYLGEADPTLRAVWARHYDLRLASDTSIAAPPTAGLFRNSFTNSAGEIGGIRNRWSVVDLSGRFRDEPIKVNNLMLTSLGAWLDSAGLWDTDLLKSQGVPVVGDLVQWNHRMTMGRDQYVKIVMTGRLFPFGHKAVEITITERRVDSATGLAFLGQKTFIMVKEPTKTYAQDTTPLNRRFPFSTVTIKPETTPQIEQRSVSALLNIGDAYWIKSVATGADFDFQIEARDWDGKLHKFSMPLIWVRGSVAASDPMFSNGAAVPILNACSYAMRTRQVSLAGQTVAFAKAAGGDDKARVMPANWIKFEASVLSPSTLGELRFAPLMYQANVNLDTVEKLTGQSAGTTIRIADIYRDSGYSGANSSGKVFAQIVSAPTVDFPASLSGALATPVPKLSGIGAVKGIFGGDLAQFGSGQFKPELLFDALNAKLIGDITLVEVLDSTLGIDVMPVFSKVKDALDTNKVVIQYDWDTPITKTVLVFVPGYGCRLKLHAEVSATTDGSGETGFTVRGELGPFDLDLVKGIIEAIVLKFDKITFESVNGASPTVKPEIVDVQFVGILKYLAALQPYLGALSGSGASSSSASSLALASGDYHASAELVDSGPLKIDVTAAGIVASLTLALPDIAVGAFSLKNMSFGAALTLPFTGDPLELAFSFCSREAPFELLIMGFGGGGYLQMVFQPSGMKSLEISLEFGAGTSFSIGGLASGMVEIKGGFMLHYQALPTKELKVTVFIRLHGSLRVIGLITVSLTFYLELSYETFTKPDGREGDKLTGTATLTVEIEILFFSVSVSLSVTKEIAGTDPRFRQLMPEQSDWAEYCSAFAPATLGA